MEGKRRVYVVCVSVVAQDTMTAPSVPEVTHSALATFIASLSSVKYVERPPDPQHVILIQRRLPSTNATMAVTSEDELTPDLVRVDT